MQKEKKQATSAVASCFPTRLASRGSRAVMGWGSGLAALDPQEPSAAAPRSTAGHRCQVCRPQIRLPQVCRISPPPSSTSSATNSEAREAFEHAAAASARFVRDPIHPSIPSSPTGVPFSEHGAAAPLLLMRSCCPPAAARIGVGDPEHGRPQRRASCAHFDVRRSGSIGSRAMRKWISKILPEPLAPPTGVDVHPRLP